jgi:hypothetical protein
MAEVQRMTVDEVVSYFLGGEGVDVLRDSLRWVCQQLMEAEVSEVSLAAGGSTMQHGRSTSSARARCGPGERQDPYGRGR